MVQRGWAFDWPKYSGGYYADAEVYARVNRLGIWSGPFVAPWDYRDGAQDECLADAKANFRRELITGELSILCPAVIWPE